MAGQAVHFLKGRRGRGGSCTSLMAEGCSVEPIVATTMKVSHVIVTNDSLGEICTLWFGTTQAQIKVTGGHDARWVVAGLA